MLILAWLLARGLAALVMATCDGVLVLAGLRWRDSMGRTRWRR